MTLENNVSVNDSEFFLLKLVRGDYGLFKTFWFFSFIPSLIFNQLGIFIFKKGTGNLHTFFIFFTFVYSILILISIWNAANKYNGKKVWIYLSKLSVIIGILVTIFSAFIFLSYGSLNIHDIMSKEFKEQSHQDTSLENNEISTEQKNTSQQPNTFEEALKAAEAGDLEAQYGLGLMYYFGQDVQKNYKEAFRLLQKSANNGNLDAQFLLGVMYYSGQGIEKNYSQALRLLNPLVNMEVTGRARANLLVGSIYYYGLDVPKDYFKAFQLLINAAEQDTGEAQFLVGLMYAYGEGVVVDLVEAYKWLNIASSKNMPHAGDLRDAVANKLNSAEVAEAQRRSSEWRPWIPKN